MAPAGYRAGDSTAEDRVYSYDDASTTAVSSPSMRIVVVGDCDSTATFASIRRTSGFHIVDEEDLPDVKYKFDNFIPDKVQKPYLQGSLYPMGYNPRSFKHRTFMSRSQRDKSKRKKRLQKL